MLMNQITHALTTIFTIPETQVWYNFKNPVSLRMDHGPNLLINRIRKGFFWLVFKLENIVQVFPAICNDVLLLSPALRHRNWKSSKCFFVYNFSVSLKMPVVQMIPVCTSVSNKGDPVPWFLCSTPFKVTVMGGLILSFNYYLIAGRLWSLTHLPPSGRVLRRFVLKRSLHFAHFRLETGMVSEGTTECMNVFIVSIPNE